MSGGFLARLPLDPRMVVVMGPVVHMRWTPVYSETLFNDGTKVPALSSYSQEKRLLAERLGYTRVARVDPDGRCTAAVAMMDWEHDVVHTMLARMRGETTSPTLWDVAHQNHLGELARPSLYAQEEGEVLALQHHLNHRSAEVPEYAGTLARLAKEVFQPAGVGLFTFSMQAASVLGRTRWQLLPYTSNSGKLLFACGNCGRISPTPDKRCTRDYTSTPCEEE